MSEVMSSTANDAYVPPPHELDTRLRRIRSFMANEGLDGLIAFAPGWRRENVRYLSLAPIRGSWAAAYVPSAGPPTLFAVSSYDRDVAASAGQLGDIRPFVMPDAPTLVDRLREGGTPESVGVAHLEFVPVGLMATLRDALPRCLFSSATTLMDRVRHVKTDWELAQTRRAARVCDTGWSAFLDALGVGVAEYEIVADVEHHLKARGAEDNFMLIASGGNQVRGMTPPGRRRLERGDMVRTELTPQVSGYWAQICRSAVVGEPTDAQRRSFELFDEAASAGLEAVEPGVTAHDVAMAENDVFRRYGLGQYCGSAYTRVRGHGHGLHPDEAPMIVEGDETVLEEGAVIIVHPNTYTPIAGYHVLGDPVVVVHGGYEALLDTERTLFTA